MNQYEIAHRSVGAIDQSHRGTLFVAGADRASWLQGLLTNDIQALVAGTGCYAAWLTPQGRMITDMRVLELGDRMLLDVPGSHAAALALRLEQLVFAEDVQVQNATAFVNPLRVIGPAAPRTLVAGLDVLTGRASVTDSELAAWVEYQNAVFSLAGGQLILVRDDGLGVPGYDIYSSIGEEVRRALAQAGAPRLDDSLAEVLRIEAGRPVFGIDMNTETIPLEAGIESRAISFSKGCYVGQEIVVRVVSRGHGRVARKLVGLVLDGARVPRPGEPLFADGHETGRVTSATWSPALNRPIALGYVHRDFAEPDHRVIVGGESGDPATVAQLPFVTPDAEHPVAK